MIGISSILLLASCGKEDKELVAFKEEIDDFCLQISEIDTSINNIDAESDDAIVHLLNDLDRLDSEFQDFSVLDFPEEYDYLETLADEAASYMDEAVSSYHEAYGETYDPSIAEFAKENYARAYKRIQIIITFLHGEEPEDVNLSMDTE